MTPRERSRQALARSLRGRAAAAGERRLSGAEAARINDAMRRLSSIERDVLLAVRLEDCSYGELAGRLGLPVVEVELLFAQALSELLRNLNQPSRYWWRRWLP